MSATLRDGRHDTDVVACGGGTTERTDPLQGGPTGATNATTQSATRATDRRRGDRLRAGRRSLLGQEGRRVRRRRRRRHGDRGRPTRRPTPRRPPTRRRRPKHRRPPRRAPMRHRHRRRLPARTRAASRWRRCRRRRWTRSTAGASSSPARPRSARRGRRRACSATRTARCASARSSSRCSRSTRPPGARVPRREHQPNEDATVWTIKVREGITFTDGTPLNADAVIDNLNRTFGGLLVSGALKDTAKNPDGTLVTEKLDDYTFTIATGKNGDPTQPVSWWRFPYFLTGQAGFIASPTWLAAVDGDPTWRPSRSAPGPFIVHGVPARRPHDRRQEPGLLAHRRRRQPAPYLDEIEFRVIVDSQVRREALESGDVDLIATSDPSVVGPLSRTTTSSTLAAGRARPRRTTHVPPHPAAVPGPRGALRADPGDRQAGAHRRHPRRLRRRRRTARSRRARTATSRTPALPEYDPDAAGRAIEAWEAANGPLEILYSTTPTGTTKAIADYLQQAWGDVGVDVTAGHASSSRC